jgi:hypothetical protein
MSDQVNFEITGSDLVGVEDYECKIDSGKWNPIQHLDTGRSVCQYSQLPVWGYIFFNQELLINMEMWIIHLPLLIGP